MKGYKKATKQPYKLICSLIFYPGQFTNQSNKQFIDFDKCVLSITNLL